MGIEGYEKADRVTKTAALTRAIRRCPEQFTSLVHIELRVMERK